ncbi:hypothetical protein [Dyella sp. C9]|uniref:hypothetical protein n=1 Tax=Dyella sp. C9 TaxID=2202154 RepID=UPI0018E554B6|nr:hypothetical protein [Dyella sp. C9]
MLGQYLSSREYGDILARGRAQRTPWLDLAPSTLQTAYNRRPFLVRHQLASHPLFGLDELFALCRRLPREQMLVRMGRIPGDATFETSYEKYRQGMHLEDVLERFEELGSYLCINNPERDASYRPLIEGLLGEVAAQTEPLDPTMSWYSSYVFISAQDSVTPYHMDREMNFLLQVRGQKTVYLWDQDDDEIMSAEQKDHLLARVGLKPPYHPSFESKAASYALEPGTGVHHPFIAPHRVHTGPQLSVSLALTFRTRQSDMWTDAHRFNARMRRLGLRPHPIGRNRLVDHAKCGIARVGQRVHRMLASHEDAA